MHDLQNQKVYGFVKGIHGLSPLDNKILYGFYMDFIWISWYIVDHGIWYTNII
jgi:hypothetical protein